MSTAPAPEQILKELSDLWVSLGKQDHAETGAGVLRACSMTLVVLAEMSDDPGSLGETVAALMPEHPARAIMVRLQGTGERELAARVYSRCWMPFGQRRQICCEQIEITSSDAALADLPALMLPLAAQDLPLIVWCRSARLAGMTEFWNIARMARKLILDSAQLGQPPANNQSALARLQEAVGRGVIVGDLAWTRLTRLREMLAQVFENRKYLELLPRVTDVKIWYPGGQKIPALYLGAWLQRSLSESIGVRATFAVAPGERFQVDLRGEGLHLEQVRSGGRIVVTVNGLSQCTNLPSPTDYLLLREELGILRRDPVFEAALAWAADTAYPDH